MVKKGVYMEIVCEKRRRLSAIDPGAPWNPAMVTALCIAAEQADRAHKGVCVAWPQVPG